MTQEQETTRQLILRVAERLFMEHGYGPISMNRVVGELAAVRRLSKPAIYYHFRDKEALYVAVLLDVTTRYGREIAAAGTLEGDLHTRVAAVAEALAHAQMDNFERMRADMKEHLSAEAQARLRHAFTQEILGPVETLFERAAQAGELRPSASPRLAAFALLSLVAGLGHNPLIRRDKSIGTLVAELLLDGVAEP